MDTWLKMRKRAEKCCRNWYSELVEAPVSDENLVTAENNVFPDMSAHNLLFNMGNSNAMLDSIILCVAPSRFNNYQAQEINTEYAKSVIRENEERNKAMTKAQIELLTYRAKHEEDLRFEFERQKLNSVPLIEDQSNSTIDVNYMELEDDFIKSKNLVKIMDDYEIVIYYWNTTRKHYVSFKTKTNMITALSIYAYEKYGRDIELSNTKLEYAVNRMINSSVPLLGEGCNVKRRTDTQVFFQNGWYSLTDNKFYIEDTREYFHTECLPYSFESFGNAVSLPELKFDIFLNYIFDGDELRIKFLYQIIGAILSDVPVKNIFVFQGVSNGGKSLLSNAIMRLRDCTDVELIGSINEINSAKSKSYEGRIKLLYIDDAPNEKWSDSMVSYLKTRSSGISRVKESSFKILLCTNYPILYRTEEGRDYSMDSRIVLLPFAKDLKAASRLDNGLDFLVRYIQGEEFEQEKSAIAMKAFIYFSEVLANNREFAIRYPLNECVVSSRLGRANIDSDIAGEKVKNCIEIKLNKQPISDKNSNLMNFLKENFELSYDEKECMTAEQILLCIRQSMPDTNGRVNEVGKPIKAIFGEECCLGKRVDGKICYKLKLKSPVV